MYPNEDKHRDKFVSKLMEMRKEAEKPEWLEDYEEEEVKIYHDRNEKIAKQEKRKLKYRGLRGVIITSEEAYELFPFSREGEGRPIRESMELESIASGLNFDGFVKENVGALIDALQEQEGILDQTIKDYAAWCEKNEALKVFVPKDLEAKNEEVNEAINAFLENSKLLLQTYEEKIDEALSLIHYENIEKGSFTNLDSKVLSKEAQDKLLLIQQSMGMNVDSRNMGSILRSVGSSVIGKGGDTEKLIEEFKALVKRDYTKEFMESFTSKIDELGRESLDAKDVGDGKVQAVNLWKALKSVWKQIVEEFLKCFGEKTPELEEEKESRFSPSM